MAMLEFDFAFRHLTGNEPFPWQRALYERFSYDDLPDSCNLPTGLGKTNVIAVWLIALLNSPAPMPRRLVYVVNRRTVVDQTTTEVEKIRANLLNMPAIPEHRRLLGISTLRGQFADNREWSADPTRPAVICGTVDMIGSRLLFSGYGIGFKAKPLHAGFLGQDVLLVHDEAHLEPAFQDLVTAIQREQKRCKEFGKFHVLELSATSRGKDAFSLSAADRAEPEVQKRINAAKAIALHPIDDEKKQLADKLVELALVHKDSQRPILVFARSVEAVSAIVAALRKAKQEVQQLTGTMRGLERDRMADPRKADACPIFARFLKPPKTDAPQSEKWHVEPKLGTVYLVCTSAGEVGVNISADHLVCDLSTFESMAQRLGRVNRFGEHNDTRIDIVYPTRFDEKELDVRRAKTLDLMKKLNGNGSPAALGDLDPDDRLAAFSPPPIILSTSDIVLDGWALTTVREKLPGRPPVEPYLHGINEWEPPQTTVAWRQEVSELHREFADDRERKQFENYAAELLADYPLKAHETLADRSDRIFNALKKLAAPPATTVWVVDTQDAVTVMTLGTLINGDKEALNHMTLLLPPDAGGLENGLLTASSKIASDVADQWLGVNGERRRARTWVDDDTPSQMRLVRTIDTKPDAEVEAEEPAAKRYWHWYVRPASADDDGSKTATVPITWQQHTNDVIANAKRFASSLFEEGSDLRAALVLAAKFHDLGKKRAVWQRSIGHQLPKDPQPDDWLAKSGGKIKPREITDYRHEFGSLLDLQCETEFNNLTDKPDLQDLIMHLIAVHHGYGRPHFPQDRAFDPEPPTGVNVNEIAAEVPRRFARLQRKYGRWGLAYLESLLRAADWAASANPSLENK
jgi:CRISPR-associated endonuclease/helicase Cas3